MFPREGGGGGGGKGQGEGTIFKPEHYFILNQPKNQYTLFDLSRNFISRNFITWHVTVSLRLLTKKYQIHLIIASLSLNPKVFRIALQIIMVCYDLIPSIFTNVIKSIIFGPTKKKDGSWRIKTNIELDEPIQHRNIINYVKSQRLSWFGHIHRKPEISMVRNIHKWQPYVTRPVGRPKQ
jgi:hypothetical protein